MIQRPTYDIIGSIAIAKFDRLDTNEYKKKWAGSFLKENHNIKTILEKIDKVKGRLRIAKTSFILGENTKETIHTENGCRFHLNVDETYFSPRLSNERKVISEEIARSITRTRKNVLVLFAGVGPFPITIAKLIKKQGKNAIVISNELNRKASKFAEENVKLNKLENYVKVVQGDAKNILALLKKHKLPLKYDFIMMARPNLKDTFLLPTLGVAKRGAVMHYHGFGTAKKVKEEIEKDLKKEKVKASKIVLRKAGEIAPFQYRWDASFTIR